MMNKLIFIVLFIPATLFAQVQKKETAHFKATYDAEAEAYADAGLVLLEAAWTIAVNNGFYLPGKMKFTIQKSERNALYFHLKKLNEIIWEYERLADFLPPDESGKNNVYGLCHELGHLCMFNTNHPRNSWMSYDYRESWADYCGNMLVDSIYEQLGIDFWPEPHDYRKYAGMDYFGKRIKETIPELQSFNQARMFWFELGTGIGFNHLPLFFNDLKSLKVDNPNALRKFAEVVELYDAGRHPEGWFEEYAEVLIINQE